MAPNGSFYSFDDSRVSYLHLEQALKSSAYILFYELDKSTLKSENGHARMQNGHSVVVQNGHTYSKNNVESSSSSLTSPTMSYAAAATSRSNSNDSSFSKPNLPKVIPVSVIKQQQKQQKENESTPSKNGVKSPGANGENQRVAPSTPKLNGQQKSDNNSISPAVQWKPSPGVLAIVKQKPQNGTSQQLSPLKPNLPSMPMISDDEDEKPKDVKNPSINTTQTPPPPSKSLVPYDDDDDDDTESMKEAKILHTSSGPFRVIDSEENAKKGPSVTGSTIVTKALNGQSIKRNDEIVQQLKKFQHNGYGTSNVVSWSNGPSAMNNEVSKDQQKEDRKRQCEHEDDMEMDRGRVKRIKLSSTPPRANGKLPNPFQEVQNKHNSNGHYDNRSSNNHYNNQNGNYRQNTFYYNNGHNNHQKKNFPYNNNNNGFSNNRNRHHNSNNNYRNRNGYNSVQYHRNR